MKKQFYSIIYSIMYSSNLGYHIARSILELKNFFTHRRYLSDKQAIKIQFKKAHGYELNIEDPKSLNEKMQWLKLYDRTPIHTLYADKFAARKVFEDRFGKDGLIDLVFRTRSWKEIRKENMPDFPIIIKPNHGSGCYHIIENKNTADWDKIRTDCRFWLSHNFYPMQREWQYKNILPCIIVEKLLVCDDGHIPINYRVHCFHGKVGLIALTIYLSNDTENYKNLKYSRDWELLPIDWAGRDVDLSKIRGENGLERPVNLEEIISIAENISKEFKYVRVDFYDVDGKLYHGEITFHDGGGYERITPFEWDIKLGEMVKLKQWHEH